MNKLVGLIILVALCSSCKKDIYSTTGGPSKKFNVENIEFNYLSSKSKVKFKNEQKKFSSSVQTRIKKDSAIWMSIVPAMGLEAARVLITKDTVLLMNRITKKFYAYNYEQLANVYGMPLDYSTIESLFTGNLTSSNQKEKVKKKGDFFVLDKKQGALDIRNKISKSSLKLEKKIIHDTSADRLLEIKYSEFKKIEEQMIPGLISLVLEQGGDKNTKTDISISNQKISIDQKALKFPFTVSSKYERKH